MQNEKWSFCGKFSTTGGFKEEILSALFFTGVFALGLCESLLRTIIHVGYGPISEPISIKIELVLEFSRKIRENALLPSSYLKNRPARLNLLSRPDRFRKCSFSAHYYSNENIRRRNNGRTKNTKRSWKSLKLTL